jgi:hypothetical protein
VPCWARRPGSRCSRAHDEASRVGNRSRSRVL